MSSTPIRDEIRNRIPEPNAIQDMITHAGDMELYLREIHEASTGDWMAWMRDRSSDWIDEVGAIFSKTSIS
jgi:hypothetical protein